MERKSCLYEFLDCENEDKELPVPSNCRSDISVLGRVPGGACRLAVAPKNRTLSHGGPKKHV